MNLQRTSTLFIVFFFIFSISKSQTQNFNWVKQFGGTGEEYGFGITVDDSSNSYVTGYMDAENNLRQSSGLCINHDVFIAKYDKYGTLKWIKQIGGGADDMAWAITTDKNHNVYITGSFQDTLFLNSGDLISTDFKDLFIAKFNSAGDLLWAKKAGGSLVNCGYGISTDSQNNVYITGSFNGTTQFENTFITSRGLNDAFLAKYDTYGNFEWAINEGGSTQNDESFALSIDKNDNVYVCGKFADTAYFSSDTIISKGNSDYFIAKHTSSGNLLWVRSAGGSSMDVAQGISCDTYGNVYLTGYFNSSANIEGTLLTSEGSSDIFITKYDPSGNFEWVKSAGGNGADQGAGITNNNGKIYCTGYFNNNAIFGPDTESSNGYADIFITCLDSLGNFNWTKNCGGMDNDAGSSIKSDTAGNVFFTGALSSVSTFGNIFVSSSGDKDFYVAKLETEISVGILQNDPEERKLIVYPNPSDGILSISINEDDFFKPIEISISDELGQQVYLKQFKKGGESIDLSNFAKGIYFLKANINDSLFCRKIILN